ncbi:MAG: hypothetical protein KKF67_03090 [Nanoarchaeota archaeon]|nr:hypothetical protein [Nanoarchaeota archaeon]
MKYQKSMMKIFENLLLDRQEKSIERIIQETKTGRNSAFNAIKWLENNGMVKVKESGNQKLVSPVIDNHTLQFKYYLDSIAFKTLDPFVKLVVGIFISEIMNKIKIKSVVLFGSALKSREFKDIDLLLLGKLDTKFISSLSELRGKIERALGVVINLHKAELGIDNLFRGVVVYQISHIEIKDRIKLQYLDFINWLFEAIKNQKSDVFQTAFNNSILNLSYVYCYMNDFNPKTKEDSKEFFNKKYKIKNLDELKKTGVEIGKKLFK